MHRSLRSHTVAASIHLTAYTLVAAAVITAVLLCTNSCQAQPSPENPSVAQYASPQFAPMPAGPAYAVPVRPYAQYQLYQVSPVQYAPDRPYPPRPYRPRPRGVWGWGPFPLGYVY